MANAIEIEGLQKRYLDIRGKRSTALAGLDLAVPEGGVFGVLGPNGAGKTTLIRCLVGLVRANAGRITLLGQPVPKGLPATLGRVGAIVEAPAMYPRFSARRNLEILARVEGRGKADIDRALDRVGLTERAESPVKGYSLGMRQRLAIAATLIKEPEVLVLDEPANGLDPAGIVQVRDLVRELGAEGRTVLVSSHILSEMRQMVDHVAILAQGRCTLSGSVEEVLARGRTRGLIVRLDDPAAGIAALRARGIEASAGDGDGALRVALPEQGAAYVTRVLAEASLFPSEIRPDGSDLESVYLELTAGEDDIR